MSQTAERACFLVVHIDELMAMLTTKGLETARPTKKRAGAG